MALFPGQNMAGSPGFQADIAHAGRATPPLPHPCPKQQESTIEIRSPSKVEHCTKLPLTPSVWPCFPARTWPVVQVSRQKGWDAYKHLQKGVLLLAPLPLLTRGWCGHAVGNLWHHAVWVGFKSTLERPPVTSQNPSYIHVVSVMVSMSHFS